jgi:hypothetical protein
MTILHVSSYKPALELTFDGQKLGLVDSKETVGNILSLIERDVSAVLGGAYEFTGKLEYRMVFIKDGENSGFGNPESPSPYLSENELFETLYYSYHTQGAVTLAYGLYIDGELILAAESEDEIKIALEEILEAHTNAEDGDQTVEFAHDIEIIRDNYAAYFIATQDELKNIISYSAEPGENDFIGALLTSDENGGEPGEPGESRDLREEEFEVFDAFTPLSFGIFMDMDDGLDYGGGLYPDGDEFGGADIAVMAAVELLNMTSEPIQGTIPRGFMSFQPPGSADDGKSGILERVTRNSLAVTPHSIQFKKTKTETYTVETPFETIYENSDYYYTGTQTVKTNGKNGESMIIADVTYIGGVEMSREIITTEVIRSPVAKVVINGTKPKPIAGPTGNFVRPLRGSLTTRFGGGHRGIDIPAPYGTPVGASDGGTVIYAGNSGSYGNHVKIRHNDGFVTLYAHFSSISVKVGDVVFQGQEVGKVGSTGRSTGNHLHFEIIRNGVQVNPEAYIK